MKRYVLVGLLVTAGVLISLAPVSLLKPLLPAPGSVIELQQLGGTLWRAGAVLSHEGRPLGDLRWQLEPAALLQGRLSYAFQLSGPDAQATGTAARGFSAAHLRLDGTLAAAPLQPLLRRYELNVPGEFKLDDIRATVEGTTPVALAGNLRWSGGRVSFPQGERLATIALPAMAAVLQLDGEQQPLAEVFESTGNATADSAAGAGRDQGAHPLLILTALHSGFVKIAVTRKLTRLAGMPWPGSEPDHAVVLEVEQQVF
ncbi:MAG: type II secretion system protein N [Pseudomonadota bacterium]